MKMSIYSLIQDDEEEVKHEQEDEGGAAFISNFNIEENKNEDPHRSVFGRDTQTPCNLNVYTAIQKHKITKNDKETYPFVYDKNMYLDSTRISFDDGQKLTNALCKGLTTGCQVLIDEIDTLMKNPNANTSALSKRYVD